MRKETKVNDGVQRGRRCNQSNSYIYTLSSDSATEQFGRFLVILYAYYVVSGMVAVTPLPQPASIDETLASFDSVPLFMKSLPQGDTDNDILGALQSLAFDGTPDGG
jgi:hypothetical protein